MEPEPQNQNRTNSWRNR